MSMLRFAFLLMVFATPLHADPCEDRFRAGMAASAAYDARVGGVEYALFVGLGWVTGPQVMTRLEGRSARTTACEELANFRQHLAGAEGLLDDATRHFSLAAALCFGLNRDRARQNIQSLSDRAVELGDLDDFLNRVAAGCPVGGRAPP